MRIRISYTETGSAHGKPCALPLLTKKINYAIIIYGDGTHNKKQLKTKQGEDTHDKKRKL